MRLWKKDRGIVVVDWLCATQLNGVIEYALIGFQNANMASVNVVLMHGMYRFIKECIQNRVQEKSHQMHDVLMVWTRLNPVLLDVLELGRK